MTATEPRLKTWDVSLPHDLSDFIEEMIAKKQFSSADALIASALHSFRDIAEARRIRHERLRADTQIGIDELERGESVDGEEMFCRLHQRLDEAEAPLA